MTEGEIVLTRDLSTGRIHKRVLLGGGYKIVLEADLTEADDRCHRCFPFQAVDAE